jgi:hypothetical protein
MYAVCGIMNVFVVVSASVVVGTVVVVIVVAAVVVVVASVAAVVTVSDTIAGITVPFSSGKRVIDTIAKTIMSRQSIITKILPFITPL